MRFGYYILRRKASAPPTLAARLTAPLFLWSSPSLITFFAGIAVWGGARISQWKSDGTLLAQFGVAATNVTSCVFGGARMNELFVTTALVRTDAAAFRKFPHAGGVFRMETNVTGMPTYEFGG